MTSPAQSHYFTSTEAPGATNIAYHPMNLAMSAWNSANGLRNVDGYDTDMRPGGIRVPNLQSWDYGYDTANRLTTMTDNLDGTLTQTLGYDDPAVEGFTALPVPAPRGNSFARR